MAEYRRIMQSTGTNQSASGSSGQSGQSGLSGPSGDSTPGSILSGGSGTGSSSGGVGADAGGGHGGGSAGGADAQHRRRRLTGHVSALACTECRRTRAKCDGVSPDSCSRCMSRGVTCVYEPHTKTAKDDLLKLIESMREEQADLKFEYAGLQKKHSGLQKVNKDLSIILDILTNNGHVDEVICRLRQGEKRTSIAEWLNRQPELRESIDSKDEDVSLLDAVERIERLYGERDPQGTEEEGHFGWTRVTQSQVLVQHLFNLYFTWVHPFHMLFSEVAFLDCFTRGDDSYCSEALVNAICAMACHLLDNPAPGIDFKTDQDVTDLQQGFMNEARSLLRPDAKVKITSLQAFAVIFLADLSAGHARAAAGYLRCSVDYLTSPDHNEHRDEVIEVSRWGIHTLNTAWSGITYQKPFNPQSAHTDISFKLDMDNVGWNYYRQPGDQEFNVRRPSFAILTAKYQARLYRIVHESIDMYCGARGRVNSKSFISCYKRYLDWKENLPLHVRESDNSEQALPHIIALQYFHPSVAVPDPSTDRFSVQYHTALVQLFLPLLCCEYFPAGTTDGFREIILSHAQHGLRLMRLARNLDAWRYGMPINAFCVIHLGDAIIRYGPKELGATVLEFCLQVLERNRKGFRLCGPLQQLLRGVASENGVEIPEEMSRELGPHDQFGIDDILDACARLTYQQPTEQIVRWIHYSISENWEEEWQKMIVQPQQRKQATGRAISLQDMLNR